MNSVVFALRYKHKTHCTVTTFTTSNRQHLRPMFLLFQIYPFAVVQILAVDAFVLHLAHISSTNVDDHASSSFLYMFYLSFLSLRRFHDAKMAWEIGWLGFSAGKRGYQKSVSGI